LWYWWAWENSHVWVILTSIWQPRANQDKHV
jgi:hypothetical protein